ncbi:MAG: amidohydrolase [Polyangia bacterium]
MMKLACTPCSALAGRWAFFATLLLSATASAQPADLVIQKAHVLTMDGARPTATTVAVRDRRIVYVGDEAGVSQLIGPRTRVVSSSGSPDMTLLPGLQDAHAHLVGLGMSLAALDLRGLSSVEAISQAVTKAAQEHSDRGQFVIGRGWDQNRFSPPNFPDRAQLKRLDEASAGHPVWLRRIDGHAGWANSAALALAGIGRKTADVAGGRILRDDSGEPTGVLIDNAMDLVERVLPQPSGKEIEAAIVRGSGYVVARGLTAVHDMGIGPDAVAAYRRLAEQGRLPLRVYAYAEDPVPSKLQQLPHSLAYRAELDRLAQRLGPPDQSGLFTLRGIKLFLDGALGSRGAALEQPYSDDPQNRGLLLTSPDHIELMARWALVHGYQLATHAIGDRAVNLVLDAYRRAGVSASRNARFRIEHTQVVSDEVISQRQLQSLGVIASVQPQHAPSDAPWATQRLGPERIKLAYAYRALLDSGAHLAGGSDFPVEEADPRLALDAALWKTQAGKPGSKPPADALSVGESVRLLTSDAAYAAFAEDRLGRISVGMLADLTLIEGKLSLDDKEPVPTDLPRRKVLLTVVDGVVVYDGLGQNQAHRPRRRGRLVRHR